MNEQYLNKRVLGIVEIDDIRTVVDTENQTWYFLNDLCSKFHISDDCNTIADRLHDNQKAVFQNKEHDISKTVLINTIGLNTLISLSPLQADDKLKILNMIYNKIQPLLQDISGSLSNMRLAESDGNLMDSRLNYVDLEEEPDNMFNTKSPQEINECFLESSSKKKFINLKSKDDTVQQLPINDLDHLAAYKSNIKFDYGPAVQSL